MWAAAIAPKPGRVGAGEKAKPGMEGATTWKAGRVLLGGWVRNAMMLSTSRKEPGQPWMKRRGRGAVVRRFVVDEVQGDDMLVG